MAESIERETARLRPGWGWVLVLGIVLVVAGVLAILQPIATSLATGIILAWLLIAGGIFAVVAGMTDLRAVGGWIYVLLGLLSVLAGIIVMINPFSGVLSLVWAIGAWLVLAGLLQLAGAARAPAGKGWLVFLGLVDIILGIALMIMDPFSALFFLAVAIGVSFVVRGAGAILFALGLRRLSRL
ncbi:HdeD family acid-resistance protein [Sphingosinicella terrae]|uniref:HdeD family acid-resistance protein n=1 Tax=Sphingosinicella terrae TaxID=2172047 RepID=UPI000E0D4152|nr:DUF308 domain-containing protein [Sphingosinicella terrae]